MDKAKNNADTLELIVQAEKHAEEIRKAAVSAAKQMTTEASVKNAERIEYETALAEAEKKKTLDEVVQKAEGIIELELKDARKSADRISTRSSKHMSDAVKAICWEMCGQ